MVTTYFPPNVTQGNLNITLGPPPSSGYGTAVPTDAESRHPGGVNFAFCDGSVRFIKNSINSWPFQPGPPPAYPNSFYGASLPVGVSYANYTFSATQGTRLGVYQALSTPAGGEVISADQY